MKRFFYLFLLSLFVSACGGSALVDVNDEGSIPHSDIDGKSVLIGED